MGLLEIIVLLIVVGVALYLVTLIPMDPTIKKVITILVVVVVILYVLKLLFGGALSGFEVG